MISGSRYVLGARTLLIQLTTTADVAVCLSDQPSGIVRASA